MLLSIDSSSAQDGSMVKEVYVSSELFISSLT